MAEITASQRTNEIDLIKYFSHSLATVTLIIARPSRTPLAVLRSCCVRSVFIFPIVIILCSTIHGLATRKTHIKSDHNPLARVQEGRVSAVFGTRVQKEREREGTRPLFAILLRISYLLVCIHKHVVHELCALFAICSHPLGL